MCEKFKQENSYNFNGYSVDAEVLLDQPIWANLCPNCNNIYIVKEWMCDLCLTDFCEACGPPQSGICRFCQYWINRCDRKDTVFESETKRAKVVKAPLGALLSGIQDKYSHWYNPNDEYDLKDMKYLDSCE